MTSSDHEGVTPEVAAFVDQVDLWDKDVPKAAAIWEWRFHFDMHWGDHAIDALRALHRACARG